MKVICIDSRINCEIMPSVSVKEGNVYEVINEEVDHKNMLIYQLAEFPDERIQNRVIEFWFQADVFIPLSNIDERQFMYETIFNSNNPAL